MNVSVIITAFKEPKTIGKAISEIADQVPSNYEILVAAPDIETLKAAEKLKKKYKNLKLIKDAGKGKPAALNLIIPQAKGKILVLTDGDVYVGKESIEKLLSSFKDKEVGAVSGRPVSVDPVNNKYGFWAHVLTATADSIRRKSVLTKKRFFCSGYLFAIRKSIFPKLPIEILSDDGYISNEVYKKGYNIAYSPSSLVYVKYPSNFSDWIKQKKRSAGGYNQIKKMTGSDMRSFSWESLGAFGMLKYPKNIREIYWLIVLFFSRVYLWLVIYRDINIKKKNQKEIWTRIESTK